MDENFILPLNGLASGLNEFHFKADKKFFESFQNSEVVDADLEVGVSVERSGHYIGVDCKIVGDITVLCDRCLEDLTLPIERTVRWSVKFVSESSSNEDLEEDGREIVCLSEDDSELDLSQIVHDYVLLSLPLKRVHKDGECNQKAVQFLKSEDDEDEVVEKELIDSPFAAIKELLKDKNLR